MGSSRLRRIRFWLWVAVAAAVPLSVATMRFGRIGDDMAQAFVINPAGRVVAAALGSVTATRLERLIAQHPFQSATPSTITSRR